jgi:uncharacterized protein YbjT (DUF2867 family)
VLGDLTDLSSMHRAIEGCSRIYFGMSVSAAYLEATVNTAAVARHHGVEAFVNMSQMTVSQMSITETTDSPQHKLHWLAEQALAWSGLPVVTVRPTVFLEGFFLLLAAAGVKESDELALPLGSSKTSPISAVDVARAVSVILDDPAPHIGKVYNLTGPESADLEQYARVFSEALGRTIRYRNVPLSGWSDKLREMGVPVHIVHHLAVIRTSRTGAVRPHDRRPLPSHGQDADEGVRLREAARRGIHAGGNHCLRRARTSGCCVSCGVADVGRTRTIPLRGKIVRGGSYTVGETAVSSDGNAGVDFPELVASSLYIFVRRRSKADNSCEIGDAWSGAASQEYF